MRDLPSVLADRLRRFGQEHVLTHWASCDASLRASLEAQIAAIDLEQIAGLYATRNGGTHLPDATHIAPIPTVSAATIEEETVRLGEVALRNGEVAVLLVAGGQGSRLGFDKPKGMYPIGPVSNCTLFQILADKVFALGRRYGKPVPFLIMTSPATHVETEAYFRGHNYLGLLKENVFFFQQGTMPAVEIATGRLLFVKPGVLFTSPSGHGGTLTALSESSLLDEMAGRGVRHIFYAQVDNPLVKIADPAFLGAHIAARSEASSKAIAKAYPEERMGVLALIDGRCGIIEYFDMPSELKHDTDATGRLVHRAGSPAIHLFAVDFLKRITQGETRLPYHIARKKVNCVDASGQSYAPTTENALKFEMFVFDALPMAERWLVVESPRQEEFSPVKNAEGIDSPATARQAMSNLAGTWLERAGVAVPRDDAGNATVSLEISPRFALDAAEFAARDWQGRDIVSASYFE